MDLRTYLRTTKTSQQALAKKVGCTQAAVSWWITHQVPVERVKAIETATNGELTRYDMRPDVFSP